MHNKRLESLSLAGARLIKLRFCGNGKDSEVTIESAGSRKVIIPLSNARVELDLVGPISITTKGWGDTAIEWEIAPKSKQDVRIEEAVIAFEGTKEEWAEYLSSFERTGVLDWAVDLRLKLAVVQPSFLG